MRNRVLVTGGVGFIGSHTVVELISSGHSVVIVDNLENSSMDILEGVKKITNTDVPFVKADLRDASAVADLFNKYNDIGSIIHFAAYKAVGESVEQPLKYYENNILSLIHLLKNALQHGVVKFVFSSSCTVYGEPDYPPVTENSPVKKAMSPYGNTKQICEEILFDTAQANKNLQIIALRYFNPFGAHPSGEIGELPIGIPQNLVPFITQTAAGLRQSLKVFGNDYNTPDGTCIRDYIDVVDLAKAHVVAVERLNTCNNKSNYELFNLGTGKGVSVLEMINTFKEATGVSLNFEMAPRRTGDIEKIWADTTYANEELGWKAQNHLADTLGNAWKWEKKIRKIQ